MSKRQTYMIEGEWTGYTRNQQRVVHREYTQDAKFAIAVQRIGWITYTDGTGLRLSVTEHKGRKVLPPNNGYGSLIRQCVDAKTGQVADLARRA
jgi:hypothetical protein